LQIDQQKPFLLLQLIHFDIFSNNEACNGHVPDLPKCSIKALSRLDALPDVSNSITALKAQSSGDA